MLPGMGQIDRLLSPDEHVHLVSREHGVVLVWPFLRAAMILAVAAAAAIAAAGLDLPAAIRLVPVLATAVVAAGALLRVVRVVSRWQRRVLVVTDRRALLLAGGLGSRAAIVPLQSIGDVEVFAPAVGRVLHYGGVVVGTGGRRGLLFGLRRLPDPDLLLGLLLGLAEERADERLRWAPATLTPAPLR
jgi:membrane protein YdbS with pleckstrin-like domain